MPHYYRHLHLTTPMFSFEKHCIPLEISSLCNTKNILRHFQRLLAAFTVIILATELLLIALRPRSSKKQLLMQWQALTRRLSMLSRSILCTNGFLWSRSAGLQVPGGSGGYGSPAWGPRDYSATPRLPSCARFSTARQRLWRLLC